MRVVASDSSNDLGALKARLSLREAELAEERAARIAAEATAAGAAATIAHLQLTIAKMKRERFGQSSERGAHLIEQLEFELADLEADLAEGEIAAETAAAKTGFESHVRRKPKRGPLPAHLPRERVVVAAPSACPCCGSDKLAKLGEDVTETLEVVPRQWKVIQHVREKWTCRACEKIAQPPAPFHVIARGRAGASLLATILAGKYAQHLPLTRQGEAYAREGVDIGVSTMADWVGACAATLYPLVALIRAHVFAAQRIHADDTTVPVLAKGKTRTGRLWAYVRDDRPFAGPDPPAVAYFYSRDRSGEHPQAHLTHYAGLMQADAYAGFNPLYEGARKPAPIVEAACWAHGRRKFYELAEIAKSPIAIEAVQRIDAIFAIEREIKGMTADARRAVRQERAAPLVADLHAWMIGQRARVSSKSPAAKAMDYMLKRWDAFARFLDDGRLCLSNNAAERAVRGIAVGRKNWTFAGSDRGGERAAAIYTLVETAKLNDADPQAWLADVLARIADHASRDLHELLPWNWRPLNPALRAAA
ncbi:MAG: IS66 family transposase [Vitreimonas sp.]